MKNEQLQNLRKDYDLGALRKSELLSDPFKQFTLWFREALEGGEDLDANAMVLATVDEEDQPSARVVLLKELSKRGFIFYTNYSSRKGRELKNNRKCAATFWWRSLQRQVRIEGITKRISTQKAEKYFRSRPLNSQRSSRISPQSEVIPSRSFLEKRLASDIEHDPSGKTLGKPEHWGGYEIIPHYLEFWQGRPNRLHDRFSYRLMGKSWIIERLAP